MEVACWCSSIHPSIHLQRAVLEHVYMFQMTYVHIDPNNGVGRVTLAGL